MPPAASAKESVFLIHGEDDFTVKQRAQQVFQTWCDEVGGMDHERLDASAANAGDALKHLARLREALQTLPFFGAGKVIWFQNCNFFGEDRSSNAQEVTKALADLAEELKTFDWQNNSVRLLISAGKIDKRKTIYRTLEKLATTESHEALSLDDRDWMGRAEAIVRRRLEQEQKEMNPEALGEFINLVGPQISRLHMECEKVALYTGDRRTIQVVDVKAVVSPQKHARAFALADALGDRDLPRLLRTLDEELWELKVDRKKSSIGVLYGLIGKVRVLLLVKEAQRAGWLKPERDYRRFKSQVEAIPDDAFPEDRRFNLRAMNPYVLFKALGQASRYQAEELIQAMDLLLDCNRQLIFSNLDESLVLQRALVRIVTPDVKKHHAS